MSECKRASLGRPQQHAACRGRTITALPPSPHRCVARRYADSTAAFLLVSKAVANPDVTRAYPVAVVGRNVTVEVTILNSGTGWVGWGGPQRACMRAPHAWACVRFSCMRALCSPTAPADPPLLRW